MFTPTEVKQIITDYHWMKRLIDSQVYEYDSTSTGQYGIEAAMPKGQGQTETTVIHHIMTENSVDQDVYKGLQNKQLGQNALMQAVKAQIL